MNKQAVKIFSGALLMLSCTASMAGNASAPSAPESLARKTEWAEPVSPQHNLFRVTPTFFRSARLLPQDVSLLQSLGIKTVVSLRSFHSDEEILKNSAIKTLRVPINTWAIGDAKVIAALRAIKAAEKDGPVLLHCQHGADRTGLVSAMYRMLYMGWSREQALDELQNGGYGYHSMWKNIVNYLQNVDVAKIRLALQEKPAAG